MLALSLFPYFPSSLLPSYRRPVADTLTLPHFFDLTPASLADLVAGWGLAPFRAKQVFQWVYGRGVVDPLEMTNLSAADRGLLKEKLAFVRGRVLRRQDASDGTHKLLVGWGEAPDDPLAQAPVADKNGIFADATECVMIPAGGAAQPRCRPPHRLPLQPGRLPRRLLLLRLGHGRPRRQPHRRPDRAAGVDARPGAEDERTTPSAGSPTSSSWAWASRWRT